MKSDQIIGQNNSNNDSKSNTCGYDIRVKINGHNQV